MDDISEPSLQMVRAWGAELIAEKSEQIDQVCEQLLASKAPETAPEPKRSRRRVFDFSSLAFWNAKDDENNNECDDSEQVAQIV